MNSPHHTRKKKSDLIAWLLDNPKMLEGYPQPITPPGTRTHAQQIFVAMQYAGLFAPRSQCNQQTITKLVENAKLAQLLHSDAKALQESIRNMEAIK